MSSLLKSIIAEQELHSAREDNDSNKYLDNA